MSLPSSTLEIKESVVDRVLDYVCAKLAVDSSGRSLEVSGLLLGTDTNEKMIVTSAVTGKQTSNEIKSELTPAFLASVAYKLATNDTDERIVGIFHSHPGMGIFISQQDANTMLNFQKLYPRFLMMVVDPLPENPDDSRYRFFRLNLQNHEVVELTVTIVP